MSTICWVHFLKGLICKNSQLIKHWRSGMASNQTYNLKASLFDEFGMRLQKHIFLKIGPLNINICSFSLLLLYYLFK